VKTTGEFFAIYHDFFHLHDAEQKFFFEGVEDSRDRSVDKILNAHGQCPAMTARSQAPASDLPDRLCTWCKVPMKKRLVASGQFIHYTCPKCIFQHTTRRGSKPAAPDKRH
jgi:hypothetical protein